MREHTFTYPHYNIKFRKKKYSLLLREGSLFPFKRWVLQAKGSYTECPKVVFSTGAFSWQEIPVQWQAGAAAGSICYLLAGAMRPLPGVTAHQWVRKRNAVSWLFNIMLWSHTQEFPGVQCTSASYQCNYLSVHGTQTTPPFPILLCWLLLPGWWASVLNAIHIWVRSKGGEALARLTISVTLWSSCPSS